MSVKLTYFDIRGLGEPIRYLLKYSGINFEDDRISFDDWPKLKPSMPFGQMPLITEGARSCHQSVVIGRYIAKRAKLTGSNDWEDLEIDAVVDTVNDLRQKIGAYYFESNPEHKERLKATLLNETIPFYMQRLENIAQENSGYLAVRKLTWADFFFAAIIDLMSYFSGMDLLKDRPYLQTIKNKVDNLPAIKKWIDVRPKTDF
ncbi:Glutathione S-transferase [Oryctes borbonicus]|uniref:glutathione transferase n=1 Tax=Oryctes borbonicus TaxID=1629725 RepID=A0A0T6B4G2_9SCAR|nr:Glutathione S-transferase [Oryctes borbonicus]